MKKFVVVTASTILIFGLSGLAQAAPLVSTHEQVADALFGLLQNLNGTPVCTLNAKNLVCVEKASKSQRITMNGKAVNMNFNGTAELTIENILEMRQALVNQVGKACVKAKGQTCNVSGSFSANLSCTFTRSRSGNNTVDGVASCSIIPTNTNNL